MLSPRVTISPANVSDVALIHTMIIALADHLELRHEVVSTEADLHDALFGDQPRAEVAIARVEGQAAGFALYFDNYSTFRGRCGIHLEDLYVLPAFRGEGVGRLMLAWLAELTLQRGCGRLEWWVLSTDEDAMAFYEKVGATAKDEWTVYRLRGESLAALAAEASE